MKQETYKAKIEYINQLDGYIILVLIDGTWCRCGGKDWVKLWDFREEAVVYIECNENLELLEEEEN